MASATAHIPKYHQINNAPPAARNYVASITAFTGAQPFRPISTFIRNVDSTSFIRNFDSTAVTLTTLQIERIFNIDSLMTHIHELLSLIDQQLQQKQSISRSLRSRGELTNFMDGDYVLVAREDFFKNEKLCLF